MGESLNTRRKPILCLDFDGVIHSYERGWRGGLLYGTLIPGFLEWLERARQQFELVIYSSRSKAPEGISLMAHWLVLKFEEQAPCWQATDMPTEESPFLRFLDAGRAEVLVLKFAYEKPPAFLTIDDRAITFKGDWTALEMQPSALREFKPWNVK